MNYSFDIQPFTTTPIESAPASPPSVSLRERVSLKGLKASRKYKVKISSFSWSKTQQRKYINFLKGNMKLFELSAKERKQIKINVLMSYAIKTRTSAQCHSHHQKMMIKYLTIDSIIESHNHLFGKEVKIFMKDEPEIAIEAVESKETNDEPILAEESKTEPLWWRYLDLMNDKEEQEDPVWSNSFFFSD